jgi:hypothetical protein
MPKARTIVLLIMMGMFGMSANIYAILLPRPKIDHRIELTEALRRRGYFNFSN